MTNRALLALLLVLAGGVLVTVLAWPTDDPAPVPTPVGGDGGGGGSDVDPPVEPGPDPDGDGGAGRTEVESDGGEDPGPDVDEPGLPPGTTEIEVHGRVLDVGGVPLAGIPVVASSAPRRPLAESDGAGRFSCTVAVVGRSTTLEVLAGRFATVRGCAVEPRHADREQILVAAPALELAGRVVDPDGGGLPDARVWIEIPDELLRGFPLPLDRAVRSFARVRPDDDGAFRLPSAPAPRGALLVAECTGYQGVRRDLPEVGRTDIVLELVPTEETRERIEGLVLLPDGAPAADARVRYGDHETTTGADGTFDLPLAEDFAPRLALAAGKDGYGPAVLPRFGELLEVYAPHPPPTVTLRLAATSLSIAGRIVDTRGTGQARWRIYIPEATDLTLGQSPPATAEGLAGGATEVETDEEGRFVLTGLLDRAYDLRAYHLDSLLAIEEPSVSAGTEDLRLVVPTGAVYEELSGRVVARDGSPLPGVRVSVNLTIRADDSGSSWVGGAEGITDENGVFTLGDVPRAHVFLSVASDDVVPRRLEAADFGDPEDVVIEVARRLHFRVVPRGGDPEGVRAEFLDATGTRLPIYSFRAHGWSSSSRISLPAGGTAVHAVSEDAAVLRAELGNRTAEGREVARQAVYLVPGEVTEIVVELR